VLGLDALTYAFLAVLVVRTRLPESGHVSPVDQAAARGGLAVGALRQLPLWPVTVVIVVGWGLSLLPFGFDVPTAVTVACVLPPARRRNRQRAVVRGKNR
jgi:hypothetical protein